jgi:hypothetical protein
MSKLALFFGLLTLYLATPLYADVISLDLQCTVAFSSFDQIDDQSKSGEITLTDMKHRPGGMIRFTQTKAYEFWVMTHSVQSMSERSFINNFQVAIKDKESGLFMHALSDTSRSINHPPNAARISLVNYHAETGLEKGELFFECNHQK